MPPRKRSRSGCLSCRKRKKKCDGTRPRCLNCASRDEQCRWGMRVSFHPTRTLGLSHVDAVTFGSLETEWLSGHSPQGEHVFQGSAVPNGDSGEDDVRNRHNSTGDLDEDDLPGLIADAGNENDGDDTSKDDDPNDHALGAVGRSDTYSQIHFAFEHSPVASAHDIHDGYAPPFSLGQAISQDASSPPEPPLSISDEQRAQLFSHYLRETGTWCNTTDSDMHFTVKSIHDMMDCKAFAGAAMALASRQLDNANGTSSPVTLELYQYTIQLLLRQNPDAANASILATCTLLCVYEMMASDVSEWRRHLRGCAELLRMRKWNGNSSGIVKTCFWAFARIDVWAAFIMDQTTLIPTSSWVNDESPSSVAENGDLDDYCNLAILIFAKIINLRNAGPSGSTIAASGIATAANQLWDDFQIWRNHRPREALPLLETAHTKWNPFPTVVYTRSSSICGNTFYHTGCILLLQSNLLRDGIDVADKDVMNPLWHARQLGGISLSNESHCNWVNHLQPLYIAGRVFGLYGRAHTRTSTINETFAPVHRQHPLSDDPPEEGVTSAFSQTMGRLQASSGFSAEKIDLMWPGDRHLISNDFPAEKIALLRHFAIIERITGWKTSGRAKQLRVLWGIE